MDETPVRPGLCDQVLDSETSPPTTCEMRARGQVGPERFYVNRELRVCPAHECKQCGEHCKMRDYLAGE